VFCQDPDALDYTSASGTMVVEDVVKSHIFRIYRIGMARIPSVYFQLL